MLIIPSIHIVHGVCGSQIAAIAHETHHADREIYSQDPIDRARLFRKENAKMLHLRFLDRDPWEETSLELIRNLRAAVDVPFGLSLADRAPSTGECQKIFDAGVYRVFLPIDASNSTIFSHAECFTGRKIIPVLDFSFDFESNLALFRSKGLERIGIEISASDTLEVGTIDWGKLEALSAAASKSGIRITIMHGVRGYPELKKLQSLGPAFDSLILSRALNENRFPCQLIWREVEAETAFESAPMNNLWTNPLEGIPHI